MVCYVRSINESQLFLYHNLSKQFWHASQFISNKVLLSEMRSINISIFVLHKSLKLSKKICCVAVMRLFVDCFATLAVPTYAVWLIIKVSKVCVPLAVPTNTITQLGTTTVSSFQTSTLLPAIRKRCIKFWIKVDFSVTV